MHLEYTEQIKLLNAIICYHGGISKVEKYLEITKQSIQSWKQKGFVPRFYAEKLCLLFERIKPEELINIEEEKLYLKNLDDLVLEIKNMVKEKEI